ARGERVSYTGPCSSASNFRNCSRFFPASKQASISTSKPATTLQVKRPEPAFVFSSNSPPSKIYCSITERSASTIQYSPTPLAAFGLIVQEFHDEIRHRKLRGVRS